MVKNFLICAFATMLLAACGSSPGPDAISSRPTYSGLAGGCTGVCHSPQSTVSPDPIATNGTGTAGKHVAHVSSRGIACDVCHYQYTARPTHINGTLDTGNPATGIVTFNVTGPTGSWVSTGGRGTGTCVSVACHGPVTMDWYGTAGWTFPSCGTCHTSSFSTALDPLATNGSGTSGKHDVHLAEGIPCEKCHSGYTSVDTHTNGVLNSDGTGTMIVEFDASNPTGTWTNVTGPGTGSCAALDCHNGTTLDWYGTNTWTTPSSCSTCHASPVGTRRQVLGAGGDFDQESHHVISYGTRTAEIVTDADCLVCHDMAHHMSGTIRLKDKDNSGQVIEYLPGNAASLEPFCLSCHDADGATTDASPLSPFSDGNVLGSGRNVAGNKIAGYWSGTTAVHRSRGLTCAGTGISNTGCHGSNGAVNMHGSPSRGLLAANLTNPIPVTATYDYNNYKLCFDCHDSTSLTKEVVLGYKQGGNYDTVPAATLPPTPYYTLAIQSLFRDQYLVGDPRPYNDTMFGDPFLPLHNYHLLGLESNPLFNPSPNWLSWNYRGDPSEVGRITCTTCHNVHGTNGTVRSTYEELGITENAGTGTDAYGSIASTLTTSVLGSYPMNCAVDCHGISLPGTKSYWHTPANE